MPPTALIVDDDRLLRRILADLLESGGFRVLEAVDGEEGCSLAEQCSPDVILVDLVMPRLDGLGLCRRLRALPQFRFTPILMLTSRADRQGAVNPFQVGADDYIAKPFDERELLARVQGNLLKKRTIADLERKADDYEALFEHASVGLAAFNRRGEFVFANRHALRIIGCELSELQGESFTSFLEPESRYRVLVERARSANPGSTFDLDVRTRSGDLRQVSVRFSDNQVGDGLQIVAFNDVTERRQMERELRQTKSDLEAANERLRQLDQARSQFISTAAHELRIPVTIVNGYCSMLREMDTENLTAQQLEFLDAAVESSDRLVDLLNNMLDLSRLEAGKMVMNIAAHDLRALVEAICRDFRALAARGGLEIEIESSTADCRALFDPEMIERVLLNLLGNAVKFTPAGGSIRVEVLDAGTEMRVVVSDTGRGIPPDRIPDLFSEFTQVGPEDSRRGTGLGLSICRNIVDSHQGRIWAESSVGQGSRFTFSLPRPL